MIMADLEIRVITEEISEPKLESLIMSDIESVEEGLVVLGNQISTSVGELDILAVDEDGILTIFELKVVEAEKQLLQGLRYLDWINSKITWISKAFSSERKIHIDDSVIPRLILIAPSFSSHMLTAIKYIDSIYIDLYEYDVISSGEIRKVILREVEIDEIDSVPEIPTISKHRDFLDEENIQELFDNMRAYFEEKGVHFEARKKRIAFTLDGKIIGRFFRRRGWFKIESKISEDGSVFYDIRDEDDWENAKLQSFEPFLP